MKQMATFSLHRVPSGAFLFFAGIRGSSRAFLCPFVLPCFAIMAGPAISLLDWLKTVDDECSDRSDQWYDSVLTVCAVLASLSPVVFFFHRLSVTEGSRAVATLWRQHLRRWWLCRIRNSWLGCTTRSCGAPSWRRRRRPEPRAGSVVASLWRYSAFNPFQEAAELSGEIPKISGIEAALAALSSVIPTQPAAPVVPPAPRVDMHANLKTAGLGTFVFTFSRIAMCWLASRRALTLRIA